MSHYMMIAKLSRRCFNLVTQMPERLKVKVTQADFIDLYGKHEKDQFELLSNLLEGRISFKDLKSKRRRVSFYVISYTCSKSNFCIQNLFGEKKQFRCLNRVFSYCIAWKGGSTKPRALRQKYQRGKCQNVVHESEMPAWQEWHWLPF